MAVGRYGGLYRMPFNGDDGQTVAEETFALLDDGNAWSQGARYSNGRYDLRGAWLAAETGLRGDAVNHIDDIATNAHTLKPSAHARLGIASGT
jgi:hypothetical protein